MRILVILPLTIFLSFFPFLKAACSSEPEWPVGCPHGEEVLPNIADPDSPGAYFDFSQGKLVYGEEGKKQGDIFLENTFIAGNPATKVALHDDLADSLLYKRMAPSYNWVEQPAPERPARLSIYDGHCVWVKTGEGKTAKFKIIGTEANAGFSNFNWIKIQWIFQPDGSNEFHDVVTTQSEPPK